MAYEELMKHVGHEIKCFSYGADAHHVAVECVYCGVELIAADKPKDETPPPETEEEMWAMVDALITGKERSWISAMKVYRAFTNDSLSDSKVAIDERREMLRKKK